QPGVRVATGPPAGPVGGIPAADPSGGLTNGHRSPPAAARHTAQAHGPAGLRIGPQHHAAARAHRAARTTTAATTTPRNSAPRRQTGTPHRYMGPPVSGSVPSTMQLLVHTCLPPPPPPPLPPPEIPRGGGGEYGGVHTVRSGTPGRPGVPITNSRRGCLVSIR